LLTVTYGTKPAPFLATKCLHQLAELEKANYPQAAKVVSRDFYMDDLLTGGNTKAEVMKLKREVTELLAKGGFELYKWNSNIAITNEVNQIKKEFINIGEEVESKLLGILWNPVKDTFHYKISEKECETRVTKRAVLSQIFKLFDPLGLVGPIITLAKILMQELWSLGIESVPMHIHRAWDLIKSQLRLLNELKVAKAVLSGETDI